MVKIIFGLVLVIALGCNRAAAQGDSVSSNTIHVSKKCSILGESEWEKVEVRTLVSRDTPKGFILAGEKVIKVHGKIGSLTDLNEKELKEIKKFTAKWKCCIAYVDVLGVEDSPGIPTFSSRGEIYFYFGRDK